MLKLIWIKVRQLNGKAEALAERLRVRTKKQSALLLSGGHR